MADVSKAVHIALELWSVNRTQRVVISKCRTASGKNAPEMDIYRTHLKWTGLNQA